MGAVEGDAPVSDNDWEKVTKGGDAAIEKWIDGQMSGKSCLVLLIGTDTSGRKWINHEICKAWNEKKGVLGIYIHRLKNKDGIQLAKGANPFNEITFGKDRTGLSSVVKAYDPPYSESMAVYSYIKNNLADWVEQAISIRAEN
jgi:Thoeris protein ThsB, TIR-like domain